MASSLVPTRRLSLISRHLSRPSLVPSLLSSLSSLPSSFSSPSRSHSSSTSSGPSSTGAKSTTAKYPYTYTTSTSLHGKPSPPSPRKSRLTQGLPDSHPLVKWREDQLKETGAPKPQGAGHDWFFVEGIQRGTEELEEGEKGVRGVVLGVADGVGGWEDQGVDPSHFSQALMFFARERVRSWSEKGRSWGWPVEKEKRSGARLQDLLQAAYEDVKKEDGIVAGSSTACIVALDGETGMLHGANLGDSGLLVFRPSPAPSPSADAPPSPPDIPHPSHIYSLLHATVPQVHFFNAPRQLSKYPASESTSGALIDYPRDADLIHSLQLEDGDVVLISTDGFGDNVFNEGEADVLVTAVRQKLEAARKREGEMPLTRAEEDAELASSVARTAVSFARMISVREDKVTPFEVESRRHLGGGRSFKGGKVDDITVVVAVVRKD